MVDIKQDVSIIITTYNQRKLLLECIESILKFPSRVKTEIIVVDDASIDNTAEFIKRNFPRILVIKNKKNLGYAKSVNLAVEQSRGNVLFLLNDDTRFIGNTVDILFDFLIKNNDAAAVAPLLINPDGSFQVSCRRFPSVSALVSEKLHLSRVPIKRWKLNEKEHLQGGPVPQPMTSALLIKRKCWDEIGPFDERFPIFFNDVDWCYRVYKNSKYKIYLCPDVKIIHYVGATVNTLGMKKRMEFYKGLIRFYLKHFPFKKQ